METADPKNWMNRGLSPLATMPVVLEKLTKVDMNGSTYLSVNQSRLVLRKLKAAEELAMTCRGFDREYLEREGLLKYLLAYDEI